MMEMMDLAVVGAHMRGLPLNGELLALDAAFGREARTLPCYRLYALPGAGPARPGLLRVAEGMGAGIDLEVWTIPVAAVGRLLARIPPPLSLGTLFLADGTRPKGFLVEAEGVRAAEDVSGFGGWRAYLQSLVPSGASA